MNKKIRNPMLLIMSLMLMTALACSFSAAATSTPTRPPTNTPVPVIPTATLTPTEKPPFALAAASYTHPLGAFTLFPPDTWVKEERNGSVVFTAPDQSGYIFYIVTNTAVELDKDSLTRFVEARDASLFGSADYKLLSTETKDGYTITTKTYTLDKSLQKTFTAYKQVQVQVVSMDFTANADVYDKYLPLFQQILAKSVLNTKPVADLQAYNYSMFTYQPPDGAFSIFIPTAWTYTTSQSSDGTTNGYIFQSPDQNALISTITYNDGKKYNLGNAGQLALYLLNNVYTSGGGDIRVLKEKSEGSNGERLTWISKKGGYSGTTIFEVNGTTITTLTAAYTNSFEATYKPVMEFILTSYTPK